MTRKTPETLRSHRWFGADDLRSFGHRSRVMQMGYAPADWVGKPVIAIVNTWSDANQCHSHFKQRVEDVKRVVDLMGLVMAGGEPVPAEWIVLLADPSARGGVRELTVANGQITGERTPLAGFSDIASRPALDRAKVLVDAGSVFEIAQREAVQCELGFHWIDYSLATNPQTLQPEWTARLYDSTGSIAGTLRLSAVGGEVIEPLVPPEGVSANEDSEKRVGGLVGKVVDFTESTAKKVQNTTLRTVGDVQEFLVGERTVGPKEKE